MCIRDSSIFTQNGGAAEEVARLGQDGMVGINIGVPVPREPFSFGGTHESKFGQGDVTGIHSLNPVSYTHLTLPTSDLV